MIMFTLLCRCPVRAEEVSLSLEEAVAIALRDNRDMLLKGEDVKKAKLKINEAQSILFPSLTFTGGWNDTVDYYPGGDIGETTTQFTVKQYLYRGGKTINTIKMYEDKVKVSQALLDKAKLDTVLSAQSAFYLLLLTNDFAELNSKILENARQHLDFVQARFQNGQASESELLAIKESLASVEQAYVASISQMESVQILLRNLLYLDNAVVIKPKGEFVYEPKEVAYDEAFLQAMQNRPEIKQYIAQEEADKKSIEIAKADNRPSIYASWDYYSSSITPATFAPSKGWHDFSVAAFTFSWPMFDGWATKAKVEQAIVDLKETQLTQEKAMRDIVRELKDAYLALKDAVSKVKATDAQITLYADNLAVLKERYRQGIASELDQGDAQLKYEISLFNQEQAIYDYLIARSALDKATGGVQ